MLTRGMVRIVAETGGDPLPPDLRNKLIEHRDVNPLLAQESAVPKKNPPENYAVVRCYYGNPIHAAFRQDWLQERNLRADDLTLVWMQDDSLEPALQPGDSVLIDRSRREPRSGQVFGLEVDDAPIVARLRSDGPNWLMDGDSNGERVISDVDSIIGQAVWVGRAIQLGG